MTRKNRTNKILRKCRPRVASYRDLYAPNRIFFPNTSTKCHGRRQPCRGILSCLEKKSLALKCLAVFNRSFFFTLVTGDRRNTGCISRAAGAAVEEKIHSKPCKSLCESAQRRRFFVRFKIILSEDESQNSTLIKYKWKNIFGRCCRW